MRLSRADLTAVFLTGTMAFASTTLYFVDQPKSRSRGSEKPVGTLIQKIRVAERKSGDEVIWEEVNNKSPVYNGDSIRTAKNSLAQLKLDDGTDLDLEQDSLIVLSMDEDGMNVNFAHGSLSAKRSETSGAGGTEGSKLKIKSGDKVVKIDKSDVSIAGGEDKKFTAMVTKGTAEITAGKEKIVVKQDEKATIAEKVEVKVVPLRLRSPDPGLRRVTRNEKEKLRFEWQGNEGDVETLEISDRPDFSSVAVRRGAPGRVVEENLAEGNWYWRVRGKSETSDVRTISIRRDQPISLLEPGSGASFTYAEVPPLIPLAWSENALVSEYQIVVSRDEAGKDIVKNQTSGKNRISLTGLPEGDYFWRVIYSVDLSSGVEETRTAPFKFSIRKEEMISPAALTSPENKTSIRRDQLTNRGLSLLWSGGNERRTDFQVIVARDADLKNPVLRKELSLPYFQVNAALDEGTYFWAVERKDRKGMPLLSEVRTFQVLPAPVPKPVTVVKTETPSTPTNAAVSQTGSSKTSNQNESSRNDVAVTGSVLESGTGFSDETSEPEKIVPKVKPRIAMSEVQKPSATGEKPVIVEQKLEQKIEPRVVEKKIETAPKVAERVQPKVILSGMETNKAASSPLPTSNQDKAPPAFATLRLRLEPEEAQAVLSSGIGSGKRLGKQEELVPGKYSLLVSQPGYLSYTRDLVLKSGEILDVSAKLEKLQDKIVKTEAAPLATTNFRATPEVLVLLDGTRWEGRVLRKEGDQVIMETGEGQKKFAQSEIDEIKMGRSAPAVETSSPSPNLVVAPDKLVFVDDRIVYGKVLERKGDVVKVLTDAGLREFRQSEILSIENRTVEAKVSILTNATRLAQKPTSTAAKETAAVVSRWVLLDSTIVEGEFLSEKDGKLKIRTAEGIRTLARSEIERILFGNDRQESGTPEERKASREAAADLRLGEIILLNDTVIQARILSQTDAFIEILTGRGKRLIPIVEIKKISYLKK